jgi:hypothetical protein
VVVGACADGGVRVWAGVPLEGSTAALNVPCDERRLHTASINFVALAEVDGRPVLVTGDAMGQVSSQFVWNFLPRLLSGCLRLLKLVRLELIDVLISLMLKVLGSGTIFKLHLDAVNNICTNKTLAFTASRDGTLRSWDLRFSHYPHRIIDGQAARARPCVHWQHQLCAGMCCQRDAAGQWREGCHHTMPQHSFGRGVRYS